MATRGYSEVILAGYLTWTDILLSPIGPFRHQHHINPVFNYSSTTYIGHTIVCFSLTFTKVVKCWILTQGKIVEIPRILA